MKKGILILMVFLFINTVIADYECSSGDINSDQKEIDLINRKSINGIDLGLIRSDEVAATASYFADLLIDAQLLVMTDNNTEIEFVTGYVDVILNNLTNGVANLNVGGNSGDVLVGDTYTLGDYNIRLNRADGSYPGTPDISGIVGKEVISLDNKNLNKIVKLNEIEYGLELFSTSDSNSIVKVYKCDDSNATLSLVVTNSNLVNETNTTQINSGLDNSSNNLTDVNISSNSNITNDNKLNKTDENISIESEKIQVENSNFNFLGIEKISINGIIITLIIVIFFFIVFYLIKKRKDKSTSEISSNYVESLRK